jgi:alanyl-tRNA synthetase
MLGNFSFGDYFKERAIELAWTALTRDFGIAREKLSVTVYEDDDEAHGLWKKIAGLSDDKIVRLGAKSNFWQMGDTGPCGPCSEIFYDHGDKYWGGPPGSPEEDGDRFIEVWNLVFMQFEQHADGSRTNLPRPSVDTGSNASRRCCRAPTTCSRPISWPASSMRRRKPPARLRPRPICPRCGSLPTTCAR